MADEIEPAKKHARPLRPYQSEAVQAVMLEWESVRSTLLVCPTASGKTRMASEILRRRRETGRALFIAQREELVRQASVAIARDAGLDTAIEMANEYARVEDDLADARSEVVVASVQTLHERRLTRWPRDAFSTIIVDEGHHATSASHRRVLDRFSRAKVCGLTATPDRTDEVGLKAVFETCAYNYEIRTAIQDGWIAPVRMMQIECADLDISDVHTVRGDLSDADLEQAMTVDAVLHQIAGPLVKMAGDRPTIVFTVSVAQAHALAAVLQGYTKGKVVSADGTTSKEFRRDAVADFTEGRVQFLLNCQLWTEGFDAPRCSCIALARPTLSRSLCAQMVGRGFRLSPETGKTDLLVLDFVGNSGRHKLVSALDVLAGKPLEPPVAALAKEYSDKGMDLEGALSAAEREMERRRKLAEEMERARVQARVAYHSREVDPFGHGSKARQPFDFLGLSKPSVAEIGRRASDAQLALAKKFGIDLPAETSKRDASNLIGTIMQRRDKDLCTYKQARVLARAGLNPDLTFPEARKAIDALVANKWQVSADIWEAWGKRESR